MKREEEEVVEGIEKAIYRIKKEESGGRDYYKKKIIK